MKTKQEKLAYLKERMKRPIRTASTICFDTETTGTNPQRNGIVDLGIVDGDGQKLFRALINPGDVEWSDGASRVNGIYKKDVAEALSMDDYRPALQKIFSAADRVVGYNVSFDIKFIEAAGLKLKPDVEIVDIMPLFLHKALKGIAAATRSFQRKRLGSHNRKRVLRDLERLHRKVANQRRDCQWRLARELCRRYAVICLETLSMEWMKRHGHGRKANDYGYAEFQSILEYVARQEGTTVSKIDRFYPSTQLCSSCGYKNEELKGIEGLHIREWDCPSCGAHHDRDRNAARNIYREGLRVLREDA